MTVMSPIPPVPGGPSSNGSREGHTLPRTRRAHVEVPVAGIASIGGKPTPDQERAIARALELLVTEEHRATATSTWKMAGRAWATRSGALDYRTRLGRDLWPVTDRLPWAGRLYDGRGGRGDSK